MDYAALLQEQGIFAIFVAYGVGVLTSFTPCVYPLIPITIALFGAHESNTRLQSFLLSLSYVLGIVVTYTSIGLVVTATGTVFGAFLGNPYVITTIAIALSLLALYTLDVVRIPGVHALQSKASKVGGKGFGGAFIMGTMSGVVAAPCVGPPLVVILTIAAGSGSTLYAAALLASYSFGLGTIFLVIGTYSNFIQRLPRSGNWMHGVKFAIAVMLFFIVLFFSQPVLHFPLLEIDQRILFYGALSAILLSSLLLALQAYQKNLPPLKVVSALVLAFAVFEGTIPERSFLSTSTSTDNTTSINTDPLEWLSDLEQALTRAQSEKKLVFVDFSADWCAACKELDKLTFPHPQVRSFLKRYFIPVKIDFTVPDHSIASRYNVLGLPLLLFLKPDGEEISGTRIQEFVPAAELLKRTRAIVEKNSH